MGDLHGRAEMYKAIARAIADAEERGPQTEETKDDGSSNTAEGWVPIFSAFNQFYDECTCTSGCQENRT